MRRALVLFAVLAAGCGGERAMRPTESSRPAASATAVAAPPRATVAPAARTPPARKPLPALPRLPVASRWSLPPIVTATARLAPAAAPSVRARVLASPVLALAPAVRAALRRGADAAPLASLVALPASAGPVLVLALRGRTVRLQATTLGATRQLLARLVRQPAGRRPALLLERATEDQADASGPPRPRPGELASLVPVYQAAGNRYGVNWRVLAAINVVETSLGANLSTSTAGAVGWMQFMPGTWREYGIDASGDGVADPYDPQDAIFAAARLLQANGAQHDIARAIFAYNHAQWYVDEVLRLAASLPEPFARS